MITIVYVMMFYEYQIAICESVENDIRKVTTYTFDELPQIFRDFMKRDDITVEYSDKCMGFEIFFIEKEED